MRQIRLLAGACATLALAGCGGAGSTASSAPSTTLSRAPATTSAAPSASVAPLSGSRVDNPLPPSVLPDSYFSNANETEFAQKVRSMWDSASPMPDTITLIEIGKSTCSQWHSGVNPRQVDQQLMDAFGALNGTAIAVDAGTLCIQDWTP